MKTVFFGPFIGEFGWELLFWQGWVRKVCKGQFREYRKIAASTPGREPFYPYVDEFWPLPESFLKLGVSGHAYYTDGWRGGLPGKQTHVDVPDSLRNRLLRRVFRLPIPRNKIWVEEAVDGGDVEPEAEAMLSEFKKRLPADTIYFVPWKPNRYEPDGIEFGLFLSPEETPRSGAPILKNIGFDFQLPELLHPTKEGLRLLREMVPAERKLIAVFPRYRAIRRPDKSWSRDKYVSLIERIKETWPELLVAIVGAPGGAYFVDGVPDGCLDLINVPTDRRMDIQVAALKQCTMALGGMSGGPPMAAATGCPVLHWGFAESSYRVHQENFTGSPYIWYCDPDPSVDNVIMLCKSVLKMASRIQYNPASGSAATE